MDEFGFSHATVYQQNSLYMFILSPPYNRPAEIMSFNETTDDDPAVMGDRLIPGTHHSRSFTSSQIIGTAPYFVRIGTINFARVFTDDVAVRSRSICLWQIHAVGARILPQP